MDACSRLWFSIERYIRKMWFEMLSIIVGYARIRHTTRDPDVGERVCLSQDKT
jgi:hypothetical protein